MTIEFINHNDYANLFDIFDGERQIGCLDKVEGGYQCPWIYDIYYLPIQGRATTFEEGQQQIIAALVAQRLGA